MVLNARLADNGNAVAASIKHSVQSRGHSFSCDINAREQRTRVDSVARTSIAGARSARLAATRPQREYTRKITYLLYFFLFKP